MILSALAANMARGRPVRIGIDLDNTIIDYRQLFAEVARSSRLVSGEFTGDKSALRAHVRALPDGERRWVELQATVYGERIQGARAMPGALDFVRRACASSIPVFIVSHKTERPAADPRGIDLREAARGWLRRHDFIAADALGEDAVFFEATRAEKVSRIGALACSAFIDDLVEVFDDTGFPPEVDRFLLSMDGLPHGDFQVAGSWRQIEDALLFSQHHAG